MPRRLAVLPLALLTFAAGLDVLHLFTGSSSLAAAAWHLITAGLLLGIAVAASGWLDRIFAEASQPAAGRDLAVTAVLVLFGVSWALRLDQTGWEPTWTAVLAGWAGVAGFLGVTVVRRWTPGVVTT
ncbi:hypothetical protein LFM09_08420 [Lentzea alba]|uniref:DUF2231 domain-containing protein n=1 Tax=Lentzea alba TaxID=2714351 RepID=UPI0039BF9263